MHKSSKFKLLSWTDDTETKSTVSNMAEVLDIESLNVTNKTDFLEELLDNKVNIIVLHAQSDDDDELIQAVEILKHDFCTRELPIIIISNNKKTEELARKMSAYPVIAIFNYRNWEYQLFRLVELFKHTKKRESTLHEDMLLVQIKNYTDSLTGALNRRGCERAYETLVGYHMSNQEAFSLIMLDIDHFKKVNDTYGHDVGDEVLVEFGLMMKSFIRKDDSFIRFGGEEFIVLLSDSSLEVAKRKAEELRKKIEITPFTHKKLSITASFGLAQYTQGTTLDKLTAQADALLYQAKTGGRNQVVAP